LISGFLIIDIYRETNYNGGRQRPSFFMEITVYTTPGCFYCDQVKELFRRAELDYEAIIITETEKENFRKEFPRSGGFPYVIVDGKHVGGLVDTAKFLMEKGLVSSKKNG